MSLFDIRGWGVALMFYLVGVFACAENVGETDRGTLVILKRLEGLLTAEINPADSGFDLCRNALIEQLAESNETMKFLPDDKLIEDLQHQAFLRLMAATRSPIRVIVSTMEQKVTDILVPLVGRWAGEGVVFYRNVEFGGWRARRASQRPLDSLLPCIEDARVKEPL